MCGGIKYNPVVKGHRGSSFPIMIGDHGEIQAQWGDHARSESLYKWTDNGWKIGYLNAQTYTEGHNPEVEFKVPEGKRIKVIYLEKDSKTIFNIVTRAANEQEAKIHPRFPLVE